MTSPDPSESAAPGEKRSLPRALRESWLGALGLLQGAEGEVARAAHRLLESLGFPADADGGHHAAAMVAELSARIRKNRDDLERRVDEGVKAAVQRVRAPIAGEIASLRGRIEQLSGRVEALRERRRRR